MSRLPEFDAPVTIRQSGGKLGYESIRSDYLFVRPSFMRGLARTLDLLGSLDSYNWSPTPEQADAAAMFVDWSLVGSDLSKAMAQFGAAPSDAEQMKLFHRER